MSWITDSVIETKEEREAKEQAFLIASIESAIDSHIDTVAKDKGYGTVSMSPTAACISYVGYPNIYQSEALAFGTWKADIWPVVHQIYADVQLGIRSIPSAEEMIAELPIMIWPV